MNSKSTRLEQRETLTVTELITKLEALKASHPNLPIVIAQVGMGSPIKDVIFVEEGRSAIRHPGSLPLEAMPARLAIV